MAQRPIREYCAKKLISKHFNTYFPGFNYSFSSVLTHSGKDLENQAQENTWLKEEGLVVKPDMLFGKRGLNQLVYLQDKKPGDVTLEKAMNWIELNRNRETALICGTKGILNTFIVEPFIKIEDSPSYYLAFSVEPQHDTIYMSAFGGIHIEENWGKVKEYKVPFDISLLDLKEELIGHIPQEIKDKEVFLELTLSFYQFFKEMHFSYLEFNPFFLKGRDLYLLDTVARIDDTARFLLHSEWGDLDFPQAFGSKEKTEIEKKIQKLDENSGSSLKLTLLNPKGLVWTLVAGGGASVVYADSIANLWGSEEIANYGEYSGNPTTEETYFYAKGVLELMTAQEDSRGRGKVLIIGGSIANFTDVAKTFDGIIKAFRELHEKMKEVETRIFVRRGGPNYEIGLRNIENAAKELGLPIEVYGPETHLTDIVRKALETQREGVLA